MSLRICCEVNDHGSARNRRGKIFKKEHSKTLFPAFLETKYQFPRQGWSSLKFSLKSKIFNENGQMDGGGGMATTEFSVVHHCEFFFIIEFKKRHMVSEINLCQL